MPVSDVDEKMAAVSEMRVFCDEKNRGQNDSHKRNEEGERGEEVQRFRMLGHGFGCGSGSTESLLKYIETKLSNLSN